MSCSRPDASKPPTWGRNTGLFIIAVAKRAAVSGIQARRHYSTGGSLGAQQKTVGPRVSASVIPGHPKTMAPAAVTFQRSGIWWGQWRPGLFDF